MRRFDVGIAIGTLFAILAMPAAAATSRRPVNPHAARMVHELARCVVTAEPDRARALLAMTPSDRRYASTFQHLIERNACLNYGTIGADDRTFKGALAEFLLLRDLHGQPLAAHVAYDAARPAIHVADESDIMSICVVRAMPGQVAALFETDPASAPETAALQAIAPALPGCLRRGARAELDRSALRAMLASAAYRLNGQSIGEGADRAEMVQ